MTDDDQHLLKPQRFSLSQQAVNYLRNLIEAGIYQPGDQLPSQSQLAVQLGISRPTLREALLGLEQEGVILLKHGVGTFIAPSYDTQLHAGLEQLESILEMAVRQGLEPTYADLEIEQQAADEELAATLQIAPGAPVTRISRVITVEDQPVAYLIDIVPSQILSPEDLDEAFAGSVLDLLKKKLGTGITHAVADIVAINADDRLAQKLEVEPQQALQLFDETLYSVEGTPVELSHNYLVPEAFRFHVIRR